MKKYMVAVFESGKGDLYENTRDLLLFNRRRSAEKAVQQAKSSAPWAWSDKPRAEERNLFRSFLFALAKLENIMYNII